MIKLMEEENISIPMELITRENGLMINNMVEEPKNGKMEQDIQEHIFKA